MRINTEDLKELTSGWYQWTDQLNNTINDLYQEAQNHAYALGLKRGKSEAEAALKREVRYLRHYGNKDCTAMADEAMARGDLEPEKKDGAQ